VPASKSDAIPEAKQEASGSASPARSITEDEQATNQPITEEGAAPSEWQAIWSPQHNAYYFHNSGTNETTWTNPLTAVEPTTSSTPAADVPSTSSSAHYDLQAAAAAQGIDPSLAYLDPSLAAGPSNPAAFTYTAKFNARTGAFARPDARNPDHVSEYERAKRMSEFYFDVNAWEQDVETRKVAEDEEGGKKRKKPTRKDLESFKERKKQKKIAKTAWLRT